jgi:hypothetical protein
LFRTKNVDENFCEKVGYGRLIFGPTKIQSKNTQVSIGKAQMYRFMSGIAGQAAVFTDNLMM